MESIQEYGKSISCIDRANFVQIEELRENDPFINLNYLDMEVITKAIVNYKIVNLRLISYTGYAI